MTKTGQQRSWYSAHSRSAGEVLAAVTQCTLGAIPVYVQFVTSNALSLTMVSMPTVCKHGERQIMNQASASTSRHIEQQQHTRAQARQVERPPGNRLTSARSPMFGAGDPVCAS